MLKETDTAKQADIATHELRQVAALPVRIRNGAIEVCLVTTRETRRWTVPKGWPMKGLKDHRAAAVEAEQEAGLIGQTGKASIGNYLYWKRRESHFDLVRVAVFRLDVEKQAQRWQEMGQREVRWFRAADAAALVDEAGLCALIESVLH